MKPLRPLRLATFAVPLSGNKGSASMLLGLRDALLAAAVEADLAVFSYYPRRDAEIAATLPGVSVHPGHPRDILLRLLPLLLLERLAPGLVPPGSRPYLAALRDCDAVLLMGGTAFADSMLYKVPWNALAALPGYLLGKPTLALSQTLGPMCHPLNRLLARFILGRAAAVHGRGRTSAAWAKRIGLPDACYRPDLSFSLAVPPFAELASREPSAARLAREVLAGARPAVGIVPNSIVDSRARRAGYDYPGFMASAIRTLDEAGFAPVLIPHCYQAETRRRHNNDRSLCAEILRRLPAGTPCFHLDADLSAGELRAVIGQLHLLVASRFHSMVSALAMGVPPITYGWGGHKYREVLEELGVPELYATYRDLDGAGFAERLQRAHAARAALSQRILTALREVRRQSDSLPREILAVIERSRTATQEFAAVRLAEEPPA
jgi:colanic acid/amylovoran biosynthesis protein